MKHNFHTVKLTYLKSTYRNLHLQVHNLHPDQETEHSAAFPEGSWGWGLIPEQSGALHPCQCAEGIKRVLELLFCFLRTKSV